MTNDEIIDTAREAGINYRELSDEFATGNGDGVEIEQMQAFAKLVAAREREKLNQMVDSIKQEAETGLVIGDEEGMEYALEHVLTLTCAHLGIERGESK